MHFPYPCTLKKEAEYSIEIVSCHINKKKKNRKKDFFFSRESTHRFWRAVEDFERMRRILGEQSRTSDRDRVATLTHQEMIFFFFNNIG